MLDSSQGRARIMQLYRVIVQDQWSTRMHRKGAESFRRDRRVYFKYLLASKP